MHNPLNRFEWDYLYKGYDSACNRFDINSPSLAELEPKPKNDRFLYCQLVKRIEAEREIDSTISLGTYEAILYWKLYSQPAAVTNTCKKITNELRIGEAISYALPKLMLELPMTIERNSDVVKNLFSTIDLYKKSLYGMKNSCSLPVRSTFLHFLYPNVVPIFDKQVLLAVGVNSKNANKDFSIFLEYLEFAWTLSDRKSLIPTDLKETPLRLLDMALWVNRGKMA